MPKLDKVILSFSFCNKSFCPTRDLLTQEKTFSTITLSFSGFDFFLKESFK